MRRVTAGDCGAGQCEIGERIIPICNPNADLKMLSSIQQYHTIAIQNKTNLLNFAQELLAITLMTLRSFSEPRCQLQFMH